MTSQAPDPREFQHWEDAFQYPLPVIRKLEQQLRTNINDNRDKVRSLVGSGYRDLLGTAERIITINDGILELSDIFSGIGQRCSSRSLEKVANYNAKSLKTRTRDASDRRSLESESMLLQASLLEFQRLLRSGLDATMLMARLLLLARLLSNSLSRSTVGKNFINGHRLKLGPARRRFLTHIDTRLADLSISRAQITDALLAYALITSSSLSDTCRHFIDLRGLQVDQMSAKKKRKSIIRGYDLVVVTVEQAQALFPQRLADAIDRMMIPQLLLDEELRAVLAFDLDICERWINPDIKSFVPWLRNKDIDRAALNLVLSDWWLGITRNLSTGLQDLLRSTTRLFKVTDLRETMLRHLMSKDLNVPGINKHKLVIETNDSFQKRVKAVIEARSARAYSLVNACITTSTDQMDATRLLWITDSTPTDFRNGARKFRADITNRIVVRDQSLQRLHDLLQAWCDKIDDVNKAIKHMQNARWDDELDLDADEEEDGFDYQTLLTKDDPTSVKNYLTDCLEKSMDRIATLVESTVDQLRSPEVNKTLHVLRIIQILKASPYHPAASKMDKSATQLYRLLAEHVISACQKHKQDIGDESRSMIFIDQRPSTVLWQGSPPLPSQPFPHTFRWLHELSRAMNGLGPDVWTKSGVAAVKTKLTSTIIASAKAVLEKGFPLGEAHATKHTSQEAITNGSNGDGTIDEAHEIAEEANDTNGEKTNGIPAQISDPANHGQSVHYWTQLLFDLLYLQQMIGTRGHKVEASLSTVLEQVRSKSALTGEAYARLETNSAAYHRKTYLLFGVLV